MQVEPTGLMRRLKEETSAHHHQSEQHALERAMLDGSIPLDTYVALLGQRFWIHRTLEACLRRAVARNPAWSPLVQDELFQEPRLRVDLAFFGKVAEAGEVMPSTECTMLEIECAASLPASLLGYHYVLEGSKNGARYLARSLAKAHGLLPGPGLTYLDPHGERQHEVWGQFKAAMDALPVRGDEADAIIASARQAFEGVSVIDDAIWSGQLLSTGKTGSSTNGR